MAEFLEIPGFDSTGILEGIYPNAISDLNYNVHAVEKGRVVFGEHLIESRNPMGSYMVGGMVRF